MTKDRGSLTGLGFCAGLPGGIPPSQPQAAYQSPGRGSRRSRRVDHSAARAPERIFPPQKYERAKHPGAGEVRRNTHPIGIRQPPAPPLVPQNRADAVGAWQSGHQSSRRKQRP
jgi:hypothetical protein